MMSDKPFPCPHKGCSMTFVNEDHLNVHRKKHDMVLNLELIPKNSNSVTDQTQTPTPTRFIRNCEEVGLFQDLQNVNPFDDTFKKALEKSGYLPTPQPVTDDTLHTPNILPHIIVTPMISHSSTNIEIPTFPLASDVVEISDEDPLENRTGTLDIQDTEHEHAINRNVVMEKLKQSINKSKILKNKAPHNLNITITKHSGEPNCGKLGVGDTSKLRRRENNRAAQFRSRMKKKSLSLEFQNKMKALTKENNKLLIENQLLKHDLKKIRTILEKHKKCQFEDEDMILPDISPLNVQVVENGERLIMPRVEPAKPMNTIFIQTLPVPVQAQPTQIQIMLPGQMLTTNNFMQKSCGFESMDIVTKCAISKLKRVGHQNNVNLLKKNGRA